MDLTPLYFTLDSPMYHALQKNEHNRFCGYVFDYNAKPVAFINVYADNCFVERFPVNLASADIHQYVPHLLSTKNCRFDFSVFIDFSFDQYTLEIVYDDHSIGEIIPFSISGVKANQEWFNQMNRNIEALVPPPSDLVFETQGIYDAKAYQDSIIPGVYNMKQYLVDSGIKLKSIHSILDIGCGTGRMVAGWFLDNPERALYGCDINHKLIDWASTHLPQTISFIKNNLQPKLPYPDNFFDLVYLVSVFTHLSLEAQHSWITEIGRILKPGATLLITLHGDMYVHLSHADKWKEFKKKGYLEFKSQNEGTNTFTTYHNAAFVKQIFNSFDLISYYPRGYRKDRTLFPIAAHQDVYIFKNSPQCLYPSTK